MPDDDQGSDEDYEYHEYKTFVAVQYDRLLSWKAGNGHVHFGNKSASVTSLRADTDRKDMVIPRGSTLLVVKTSIKLVDRS
ncbi:hypothetical protein B0T16DRAFT_383298 [Cercophora newfieldiana]|uniref:Uncharacterized protein n=1 Tax=Cercophora newfieldiana TaxID=92897 RepID=A0AA39XV08_9PEZI|nr:hypothetical protein B0T16DRAFT_383298 [Cercophora newfieldiana]